MTPAAAFGARGRRGDAFPAASPAPLPAKTDPRSLFCPYGAVITHLFCPQRLFLPLRVYFFS